MIAAGVRDAAIAIATPYVQKKESLRLMAYLCPARIPTIGWGHTLGISLGMMITRTQAEAYLRTDMDTFCDEVLAALKIDPTAHQLAAMISLAFNIGDGGFTTSSVVRFFNASKLQQAADAFLLWRKITVVDDASGLERKVDNAGLLTRRREERAMFLTLDNAVFDMPVEVIPDMPEMLPDAQSAVGLMPQRVEPASPAGGVEKIASSVVAGGGVTGGLSLLEKASNNPVSLALLLVFLLLLVAAGVWYWRTRIRKG